MRTMKFLVLFLISTLSWADDPIPKECAEPSDLEKIIQAVKKNNTCTPKFIDDYGLLYPSKEPKIVETIHSNQITGTKAEIEVLKNFVGEYKGEAPLEFDAVAKACDSVLCILTKLLDNQESAYRVLNIAAKTGYVVSLAEFEIPRQKKWELDEIKKIEDALELLPSQFYHLKSLKQFQLSSDYICKASQRNDSTPAASYGGKDITICESARGKKLDSIIIIHEVAHAYDHNVSEAEYAQMDKWLGSTSGFKDMSAHFVSGYAQTNIREDFAESVAWYVVDPMSSLMKTPDKYNFVKNNVFRGEEFFEPKLDKKIEKQFQLNKILLKCLTRISTLGYDSNYQTGLYKITFDDKSYCSKEIEKLVLAQIASKPLKERCALEKEFAKTNSYINKKVNNKILNFVSLLMTPIKQEDKKFKESYKKKCLSNNDFTANCLVNQLALTSPNALTTLNLNKDERAGMMKKIVEASAKDTYESNLVAGFVSSFNDEFKFPYKKTDYFQICFDEIDKVDLFPLKKKMKISSSMDLSSVRGKTISDVCTESIVRKIQDQKIKFDPDESNYLPQKILENVLESSHYRFGSIPKPFGSIEKLIFEKALIESVEKCSFSDEEKDRACKRDTLRESIAKWGESEKIDSAPFLQDSFLDKLMSKIKWP
jgi:hypothetical protein